MTSMAAKDDDLKRELVAAMQLHVQGNLDGAEAAY